MFNYYGIQPRPQLTLAKFDGDVLKFGNFTRQFGKYVEEIYSDYYDRVSFLRNLCVGHAQEVIAELSCLENRMIAYKMAWSRLEKRFGNPRKLLTLVKQDLLDRPPIKEWDARLFYEPGDKMYKCETSFQGWEKE